MLVYSSDLSELQTHVRSLTFSMLMKCLKRYFKFNMSENHWCFPPSPQTCISLMFPWVWAARKHLPSAPGHSLRALPSAPRLGPFSVADRVVHGASVLMSLCSSPSRAPCAYGSWTRPRKHRVFGFSCRALSAYTLAPLACPGLPGSLTSQALAFPLLGTTTLLLRLIFYSTSNYQFKCCFLREAVLDPKLGHASYNKLS